MIKARDGFWGSFKKGLASSIENVEAGEPATAGKANSVIFAGCNIVAWIICAGVGFKFGILAAVAALLASLIGCFGGFMLAQAINDGETEVDD